MTNHVVSTLGYDVELSPLTHSFSKVVCTIVHFVFLQKKLPDKNITNFTRDWNDGTNIAALVDAMAPGLCPENEGMDPANAYQNANHAMQLAEDWLDVPMAS